MPRPRKGKPARLTSLTHALPRLVASRALRPARDAAPRHSSSSRRTRGSRCGGADGDRGSFAGRSAAAPDQPSPRPRAPGATTRRWPSRARCAPMPRGRAPLLLASPRSASASTGREHRVRYHRRPARSRRSVDGIATAPGKRARSRVADDGLCRARNDVCAGVRVLRAAEAAPRAIWRQAPPAHPCCKWTCESAVLPAQVRTPARRLCL